jgi:hypothetical protein
MTGIPGEDAISYTIRRLDPMPLCENAGAVASPVSSPEPESVKTYCLVNRR